MTIIRASSLVLTAFLSGGVLLAQAPDASQLVQKGRRLVAEGKFAEGLALYEQALAAQPASADAHLAAGIVLDLMGRYADARKHLARAIELAPDELKANTLRAMAHSFVFERRTADAAKFYQQLYDMDVAAGRPDGAAATANALGRLYLETVDTKRARKWYETGYEMARRQPDEPASQLKLWEFRWRHAQGRIAAREGDGAAARRHVEAARELVTSTQELKDELPTLAYLAGYVALYLGDLATARAELAKGDQDDAFVLMLQAEAAEKARDVEAARTFWQQVLDVNGHGLQDALSRPQARKRIK